MWGVRPCLLGRRSLLNKFRRLDSVCLYHHPQNVCRRGELRPAINTARLCQARIRFFTTDESSDHRSDDTTKEGTKIEEEEKTDADIRQEILESALNYVSEHGWTRDSLALGAEEAGYASVAEGMFKKGGIDLVMYVVKTNNEHLNEYMESIKKTEEGEKLKTSQFIRDVLEHRLRMIIPYIDVWPDAMAILMQPGVIVDATRELSQMVDDIWHCAGDTSTDFNWYTKRGLLAKLFVSVQSVMINDQSPDFADSWEFLDRRMDDIASFGKVSTSIQKGGQMACDVAFAGFTVMRNVAGVGERRR